MKWWPVALLLILQAIPCFGAEFSAGVRSVDLTAPNQHYLLSAELDYRLSNAANQALQNGVPLYWQVHIKLEQHRDYIWNKILVDFKLHYRIQYHALLNVYRVTLEDSGDISNFSTLTAALNKMSVIRNLPLIATNQIAPDQQYSVAIKLIFDRDALPLPLRPVAYANPEWFLSSDWSLWPLPK